MPCLLVLVLSCDDMYGWILPVVKCLTDGGKVNSVKCGVRGEQL